MGHTQFVHVNENNVMDTHTWACTSVYERVRASHGSSSSGLHAPVGQLQEKEPTALLQVPVTAPASQMVGVTTHSFVSSQLLPVPQNKINQARLAMDHAFKIVHTTGTWCYGRCTVPMIVGA